MDINHISWCHDCERLVETPFDASYGAEITWMCSRCYIAARNAYKEYCEKEGEEFIEGVSTDVDCEGLPYFVSSGFCMYAPLMNQAGEVMLVPDIPVEYYERLKEQIDEVRREMEEECM